MFFFIRKEEIGNPSRLRRDWQRCATPRQWTDRYGVYIYYNINYRVNKRPDVLEIANIFSLRLATLFPEAEN